MSAAPQQEHLELGGHPCHAWPGWKAFLFPAAAEEDPGFRREIEWLGLRGLYIIAGVTLVMPVLGFLFHQVAQFLEPQEIPHPRFLLVLMALAVLVFGFARTRWGKVYGRAAGLAAGFGNAAVLTWGQFQVTPDPSEAVLASLLNMVVVLLVAVAALPCTPLQILGLGAAIGSFNYCSALLAQSWGMVEQVSLHHYAGLDLVTVLCTALAGFNYQLILGGYRAHNNKMTAQSRLLTSEHAGTISRFAATLSHELNSPLGALSSSLASLERLESRKRTADEAEKGRLKVLESELVANSRYSLGKLTEVVRRMQRLTNLDRAEVSRVRVEEILRDVAAMIEPEKEGNTTIELELGELPELTARPQQLSAVFARLLHNAVEANHGKGVVVVRAQRSNGQVEVVFRDQGGGLSAAEAEGLFEPGFENRDNRVASNWGLFSSRQAVREYGGEIEVASTLGEGTAVTVRLPVG